MYSSLHTYIYIYIITTLVTYTTYVSMKVIYSVNRPVSVESTIFLHGLSIFFPNIKMISFKVINARTNMQEIYTKMNINLMQASFLIWAFLRVEFQKQK